MLEVLVGDFRFPKIHQRDETVFVLGKRRGDGFKSLHSIRVVRLWWWGRFFSLTALRR